MTTAAYIAIWAYLFTGPLSEAGQIFGPLKSALYRLIGKKEWLFNPLIGCPKCHAGQVALWWQVWQYSHTGIFNIQYVILAIFFAVILEKMQWLN